MSRCCSLLLNSLRRSNVRVVRCFRVGYLNGLVLLKSEGTDKWSTKTAPSPSLGGRKVQRLMEVPEERKITVKLLDENGATLGIMQKSQARNVAFHKELILIELPMDDLSTDIVDTEKSSGDQEQEILYTEVCQLQNKAKADKIRKELQDKRKVDRLTQDGGESEVKITTEMGKKHFEAKLKQIDKWIDKRRLVKIHLMLNKNSTKSELDIMKEEIISHVSDSAAVTKEKYSTSSIYLELSPFTRQSHLQENDKH